MRNEKCKLKNGLRARRGTASGSCCSVRRVFQFAFFILQFSIYNSPLPACAHPLGNFTVNHFTQIQPEDGRVRLRCVIDMAEIAALQEMQRADSDRDGGTSVVELDAYSGRAAEEYARGLRVTVEVAAVPVRVVRHSVLTPAGAGGLRTLRMELDLEAEAPASAGSARLRFEDRNHPDRIGWREIVVTPGEGVSVWDSSAYGSGISDELRSYPAGLLSLPLNERAAEFSFGAGPPPSGAAPLRTRDGQPVTGSAWEPSGDRLAALITVPELTPLTAFLGLLIAFCLGAGHALSPGHGKTVVGAYLVGSRGTLKHAAFLGLTVTVTHTAGVFALGLITLFASRYVLPERLYPLLSLASGAIVLVVGATLFTRRLPGRGAWSGERGASRTPPADHAHSHEHRHTHAHDAPHLPTPNAQRRPTPIHTTVPPTPTSRLALMEAR